MNNLKIFNSYVKLQFLTSIRNPKQQKKSTRIISWIAKLLLLALICFAVFVVTAKMVQQTTFITGKSALIFFVTITQIALLIYSISKQIKRLYKPDDLRLILTMPIKPAQRFVAEILVLYIKLTIISLIVFWPIIISYSLGTRYSINVEQGKLFSVQFVFSALLGAIFLPILPFSVSLIFCAPFMFLDKWISNKNVVKFIIMFILFTAAVVAYAVILIFISNLFYKSESTAEIFKSISSFLGKINKQYNPCFNFSEMIIGNEIAKNFGISLGISLACALIGVAVSIPTFRYFSNVETITTLPVVKKQHITSNNKISALFIKELKSIVRNPTFALFYIGVAIAMPLLVYLIIGLILKIGEQSVGSASLFGFSMMALTLIISLIGSYSANVISKEEHQFYLTKLSPISARKQLLIKLSINFTISFITMLFCLLTSVIVTNSISKDIKLSPANIGILFGVLLFFLIGITFNGANLELANPKVSSVETSGIEGNVVSQVIIAVVIASLISVFDIIFGAINTKTETYVHLICLALMFIYGLVNFLIFWFTCEKKYQAIEIR